MLVFFHAEIPLQLGPSVLVSHLQCHLNLNLEFLLCCIHWCCHAAVVELSLLSSMMVVMLILPFVVFQLHPLCVSSCPHTQATDSSEPIHHPDHGALGATMDNRDSARLEKSTIGSKQGSRGGQSPTVGSEIGSGAALGSSNSQGSESSTANDKAEDDNEEADEEVEIKRDGDSDDERSGIVGKR